LGESNQVRSLSPFTGNTQDIFQTGQLPIRPTDVDFDASDAEELLKSVNPKDCHDETYSL
jgi:hypothetical protein